MTTSAVVVAITCSRCGTTRETKPTPKDVGRLPRGWKRTGDQVWCDRCWREAFVLRAITIPVVSPHERTWEELRATLKECWRNATMLSNWAVTELARADVTRMPSLEKLPAMPRKYLYPGAREILPSMDSGSVVALLQAVEQRYRKARYDVIWRRASALPTFRYPTPYPVHNQRWSVRVVAGGALVLTVPLGGERWELRLKGGSGFQRQRRAVLRLIEAKASQGELSIYQRGSHVMAKMVMWLPRKPASEREREGTLVVTTARNALWTFAVGDDEPQHYHADRVRQWIAAARRFRTNTAEDRTLGRESPKGRAVERQRANQELRQRLSKHHDRLNTWVHESTTMLAKYAERRGVACVTYDDQIRDYAELPWYQIREQLSWKLSERGIEFVPLGDSSGDVVTNTEGPLETR